MSTGRTIYATNPLIRMFYSQLDARFKPHYEIEAEHIESLFLKKFVQQHETYSQVVQSSLDTVENEPLGVYIAPFTAREVNNLRQECNDEEALQEIIDAGKRENMIEDPLTERDMQVIKNVLKSLKKDGLLYNALIENHTYDSTNLKSYSELDKKIIVMASLEAAGLLPVIQYVICDSLLTGGRGCGQTATSTKNTPAALIQELSPVFAATGFTLDDFFSLCRTKVVLHKSIMEMAIELDSPEILLAVMNKDKFQTNDIKQPQDSFLRQSIEQLVNANHKTAIKKRIHSDIVASRIVNSTSTNEPAVPKPGTKIAGPHTAAAGDTVLWASEKVTPTHNKIPTPKGKMAREPSMIALSPYGSGRLHLHASKAIMSLPDAILCHLVSAVSKIIYAAETYLKKYPQPVKRITGIHTHQEDAQTLVSSGKKFHEDILTAATADVAKIAQNFLLAFDASTSKLSAGELTQLVLTQKILKPISLAARTINNRNCDKNTAADVKNSLEHLAGLSISTAASSRAGIGYNTQ
jgi:hypothetical protein